jgi:SAM-dependent methyltransferase
MSADEGAHYVLGHAPREMARLERQAAIFDAPTRALLERCGICPGQRVLDLGCGAGDVTLALSDFVGPDGHVIGVDRAAEAVIVARGRAAGLGRRNVTFVHSTIEALDLPPVDAVVGRFVLMHQAAPGVALAHAARQVRSGGVVAMMESHLDALVLEWHSWPASAAYANLLDVMLRTIKAAGGHTDMGLRLRGTFLEAGLPDPAIDVHGTLAGGDAARLCHYMADSLRSMAAMAERLGVEALPAARIAEMERGMLSDAERPGAVMNGPIVVTAWCRRP